MGQDKALISLQGVPLLVRVCGLALQCASEVYVVTPWPERYQEILPDACTLLQEAPLLGATDQNGPGHSAHGPLVGFAQGLTQVQTDWVLLLACDLPRLKVEILQRWIEELTRTEAAISQKQRRASTVKCGSEIIAFLPRQAKGWEPLCGFYRRSCLPGLTDFINQGGRSFQQWLADHSVQELPLLEDYMLFNCNRPEDLALLKL